MRFIPTTEGFVNLDYVVGLESRHDGDRWLVLTATRETFICDCSPPELEIVLGISPEPQSHTKKQASLTDQPPGRETALH